METASFPNAFGSDDGFGWSSPTPAPAGSAAPSGRTYLDYAPRPGQQPPQQQQYPPQHYPPQQQQYQQEPQAPPASSSLMGGFPAGAAASMLGAGMSFMTSQLAASAIGGSGAAPTAGAGSDHALAQAATAVALETGTSYLRQNARGWFSWLSLDSMRPYFHVSNLYVLRKIGLVLFPYPHRDWSRRPRATLSAAPGASADALPTTELSRAASLAPGQSPLLSPAKPGARPVPAAVLNAADGMSLPPEDLNAPDLYLPLMSFITYVLLRGYVAGLADAFHPEKLSALASSAFAMLVVEMIALRLTVFLAGSALAAPRTLDSIATAGYKYIGYIVALFIGVLFGRLAFWVTLVACAVSHGVFVIRVLSASTAAAAAAGTLGGPYAGGSESLATASCRRTSLLVLGALQVLIALFLLRGALPDTAALAPAAVVRAAPGRDAATLRADTLPRADAPRAAVEAADADIAELRGRPVLKRRGAVAPEAVDRTAADADDSDNDR